MYIFLGAHSIKPMRAEFETTATPPVIFVVEMLSEASEASLALSTTDATFSALV